jgi:hypothetical protein
MPLTILPGDHPVGQIALFTDLHRSEDAEVDLATADHREAVVAAENRGAWQCGDRLLAGVDQVGVDLVLGRKRADAQHAVLALQPDFLVRGHKVGHQRRDADAQVDIKAVLQLLCGTCRHLVLVQAMVNLLL